MVAAAVWAFGLSFLVMGNIIGRYFFDAPIYGTAEIVAASIVIIVFLQAGYAIRSRSMLKAEFLVIHLPDAVQRIFLAIGYLLGAAFFLMIITGGWEESILSYVEGEYEGEGALRVPSWPARWTVLIVLPVVLFPGVFLLDLYLWMSHFGKNLDPDAPLSNSIEPFVPPILGTGTIGQFKTVATPGIGLILATIASVVLIIALLFHRRAYLPLIRAQAASAAK